MAGHVVTAQCVMVRVGARLETIPRGGAIPDGADADHVQLLVDRGMVAEGEPAAGLDLDPNAPPPFRLSGKDKAAAEAEAAKAQAEADAAKAAADAEAAAKAQADADAKAAADAAKAAPAKAAPKAS